MTRLFLVALCALTLIHCGPPKHEVLEKRLTSGKIKIDDAFRRGQELMKESKFIEARNWMRLIENNAPNGIMAPEAKLAIADSYFFDKMATYVEASVEYKSFMTHFPTSPMVDYAQYQYAMCFFTEIESADRDQTSTWTAYTEFKNLMDRFPNSSYAVKAKEKIELCLLRLAEHEFTVGYYYFRRGLGFEMSAESRFKGILDNYEGQYDQIKTYFYLAETLWRRDKYKEAMVYYKFLDEKHPDSEYQPFVADKIARYVKISEGEEDPGEITVEGTSDHLKKY